MNRRELMATLLGAPALLAGCQTSPPMPPEGALYGQSVDVGHRLRDGFRPRPRADQWRDASVVIVGGGAAGLSAAHRLRQAGCEDFVVLELEPESGGTSRWGQSAVTAFPWAAHYIPVPLPDNPPLIALLQELGVVESLAVDGTPVIAEQFLCREPEERLFYQGEWIEGLYPATDASADDLRQLAAFRQAVDRWVRWRDTNGRRAFAIPTRLCSDAPEVVALDQLSMAEWLRQQGWTSERLHWLVDYSCRDDYGLTAENTSAWAGLLYFVARLKAPGSEHQPLITWPEGNGRLIAHLADRAGSRLKTGTAVALIRPSATADDGPIEVVGIHTATQDIFGYKARHVIYAAPQFLAPRLIDGFAARTSRQVDHFRYGTWLVANLHLHSRPRETGFPLSWDNVLYDSRSLGYVVSTHQSGRDHGPTVLTWYYPYSHALAHEARERLLKATWAELAHVVLTDLEQAHPDIRSLTTRLDVFRWGHAMIQPWPGFHTSPQRAAAWRPDGRIHFANTDLSGIALFEEAFDHGCRVANEVLERLSTT